MGTESKFGVRLLFIRNCRFRVSSETYFYFNFSLLKWEVIAMPKLNINNNYYMNLINLKYKIKLIKMLPFIHFANSI